MSETVKKPINKGVVRVPVVMQLEALECGAASLCMILAYYGKWIPLEQVREDCGVSRDGAKALNMLKAARYYGLNAKGYRYEPQTLKEKGTFPCIVHWNFNHFVVLDGFKGNKAYINDPSRGTYTISMEEFDESFTGICLMFSPSETFKPSGKQKSMIEFAAKRLAGMKSALVFVVLTAIIAGFMEFTRPVFSKVFVDHLLTGADSSWKSPFLILLAVFNLVEIVMSGVQAVYSIRINGKLAATGNASYMWKVLKLPMRFFSQRMAGDIKERQSSNAAIYNTLINTFGPLLLNAFMMIFYFVIMVRYSIILTAIGLASLIINSVISRYISRKRINITRVSMLENAKLSAATVTGIDMIETIKASGAEGGFFKKWAGYQASVNTQQIKFLKVSEYFGMTTGFVQSLTNNIILIIGTYLAMKGHMTIGMIMAFQGFYASFMAPASTMINAGQTIQEMRTQMERIDDVMEYPDDSACAGNDSSEDLKKLSGKIEMKNVTFGYAPLSEPLIKDFSLTITPGKSIAIVGASGCGKSTIAKLISGLYKPWSGEILFDGKPLGEIPKNIFRGSLAVVDQDIILFEDTIANNIKMWDESIEDFEMILAARDAQIHEEIIIRPKGYQYIMTEDGKDFSGGQRQRIEVARALVQDPSIIILDEATAALDAETEYEVVKAIADRGITSIVIAHRLSTIRSCDEIVVMENGEIVAHGTHTELLAKSRLYNDIVNAE